MARTWSSRARRDFTEREDYRKREGEEDRYKKRDSDRGVEKRREDDREERRDDRRETRREDERDDSRSDERRERDAREDRRDERGFWWDLDDDKVEAGDVINSLTNIRNAGPEEDVEDELEGLRRRYDYYEAELDRYDADYDELMNRYKRLADDNRRYMMRDARDEGREVDRTQDVDIKDDGEIMDYDDLWKKREG